MLLGIAGLADVDGFLRESFPERMQAANLVQGMDAAAALICNGHVIAAASQERFDRVKKSGAFPYDAIDYCLETAGVSLSEVEAIYGNFDFARYRISLPQSYYQRCLAPAAIQARLAERYGKPLPPFHSTDHHDAHLHAALVSCPFDDCLAVVMDAAGEIGATSVYELTGRPGVQIRRLKRYSIRQSLGVIYSLITQFLGFAPNEDEYKVMGLASFGNPERYAAFFQSAIRLLPEGEIEIPCLKENHGLEESLFFSGSARIIREALGEGFDEETGFQQRADLSAALQQRFSEALTHITDHFQALTGKTDLLLSGGCAENCNAVGELRRAGKFQRIHVAYASGDEGTALGAAAAHSETPVRLPGKLPFFGPAPLFDPTAALVSQHGLRLHRYQAEQQMLEAAAEDIAANKIVAICHGRMEYGARALGNRSLLALPSDPNNKERINLAIKKRQNYRPFAPAVTVEEAHRYFELDCDEAYPYMTMLTRVRPGANVPAVTHVDGTARVQTVDPQHNANFYHLLTHLKKQTGVPVVLNTSYNVNHQPIVCSEAEAIQTYIEMEIDALYMAEARITRS